MNILSYIHINIYSYVISDKKTYDDFNICKFYHMNILSYIHINIYSYVRFII